MPLSPLENDTISLTSGQVHTLTMEVLSDTFSEIEINGYKYTDSAIWDVLLFASVNRLSIKSACETLQDAPSYNWVYTTLKESVLWPYSLNSLEKQINEAFKAAFPKRLTQRGQKVAIDLMLIPYYGDEATDGIYRSQAKKSTTKFFCYGSAYLIKKHKRVTLVVTFVGQNDTLLDILLRLLCRIHALGIGVKRLYLDRGFASVKILDYLSQQPFVSVVAIPKKGNTLKGLQRGKKSTKTVDTMTSPTAGQITFPLWMAVRYRKGRAKKHGVQYLFFAVLGDCRSPILQVAQEYRRRFGIESSYRIMNRTRAMTTSKDSHLRLLLVGLAFLLTNLWVWLKWNLWLIQSRRQKSDVTFTLNTFCHFIIQPIKATYGTVTAIQL